MSTIDQVAPNPKSVSAATAKQSLTVFASLIDDYLKKILNKEVSKVFGHSTHQKKLNLLLLNHVAEHTLRSAKRLRAAFVYYGYSLLNGKNQKSILMPAAGIELIQSAILMHDDFMDQDEIRRSLPTTHKYFESIHRQRHLRFDPIHFGEALAVTTGDLALCLGFELIALSNFPEKSKNTALSYIHRSIALTALGQAYDLYLQAEGQAKEADILNLHQSKTSLYTYESPLHVGALLAGAKPADLKLISSYALPAGIAFQLQDDILGLFGDEEKTGKSSNSDIKQGKVTLLYTKALQLLSPKDQKILKSLWGKADLTQKQAEVVRNLITSCGSLSYSKDLSFKYAQKSLKALPKMKALGWKQQSIDFLEGITQYMIQRDL